MFSPVTTFKVAFIFFRLFGVIERDEKKTKKKRVFYKLISHLFEILFSVKKNFEEFLEEFPVFPLFLCPACF